MTEYTRICNTIRKDQRDRMSKLGWVNFSGLYQKFLDLVLTELEKINKEGEDKISLIMTDTNKKEEKPP